MRNPYTERAMISDPEMFFGRQEELESLFSRLTTMQSCSVLGERRIGKSSLLYHLVQPETYRQYLENPERYVFAFLDLQTVGEPTRERFFRMVLEKFSSGAEESLAMDYEPTYDGFHRFVQKSHDSGWQLILCLDEFEAISGRGEFDDDFFAFLRGLGSGYNLAFVTSSYSSLHNLCHRAKIETSQFWNIFTTIYLGLLKEGEAQDLITVPFAKAGLEIDQAEIDLVKRLAGRHPFFIQVACAHLFEAKNKGMVDYGEIEARFKEEAEPHFAYLWRHLDDAERLSLHGPSKGEVEEDQLRGLERKGVVVERDGEYGLFSQAFEEFVAEQAIYRELDRLGTENISLRRGLRLERCFLTGGACSFREEIELDPKRIFIGMPFRDHYQDIHQLVIVPTLEELGLTPWKADDVKGNVALNCKICRALQESGQAIINISEVNANIFFEVGLAYGMGKSVLLLKEKESVVPSDLRGIEYTQYDKAKIRDLKKEVEKFFRGR